MAGPSAGVTRLRAVQRWDMDSPLGDPVHEWFNQESLREAGMLPAGGDYKSPEVSEYARGARWNDDPTSQLLKQDKFDTSLWGEMKWGLDFKGYESEAKGGKAFGPGDNVMARSHFGDLQFLHGMASKDQEDPEETRKKMMMWSEFTTRVASGEIGGTTTFADLGKGKDPTGKDDDPTLREIAKLFPDMQKKDINTFFGIKDGKGDVKQRAMGSLMHMVQDTYSQSHTERDASGNIASFRSYVNQDSDKHGEDDKLRETTREVTTRMPRGGFGPAGWGDLGEERTITVPGTPQDRIAATPGGSDAVKANAELLKIMNDPAVPQEEKWAKVQEQLNSRIFTMSGSVSPAGPGEKYMSDDYRRRMEEEQWSPAPAPGVWPSGSPPPPGVPDSEAVELT